MINNTYDCIQFRWENLRDMLFSQATRAVGGIESRVIKYSSELFMLTMHMYMCSRHSITKLLTDQSNKMGN